MRRRGGGWTGALAALVLLAGCEPGSGGPGSLTGSVEGPVPLGAAILEVRGAGVLAFEGVGDTRVFSALLAEEVHRVVLIGGTPGELRYRVRVNDVRDAPPVASVLSASDGADLPVASLQAFRARLSR